MTLKITHQKVVLPAGSSILLFVANCRAAENLMTTVGGGVKGLVARAQREAQKRGQPTSTAHLLLVMLQAGGPSGVLLSRLGVREGELLNTIKLVDSESTSALERAMERAYRLAQAMGSDEVMPAHLLLALSRDSRSAAHRSLEKMGAEPAHVQRALATDWGFPELPVGVSQLPPPREPSSAKTRPSARRNATRRPMTPPRPNMRKTRPEPTPQKESDAVVKSDAVEPEIEPIEAPQSGAVLDPKVFPTLTTIGRNLSLLAEKGAIDPLIGRDEEIEQLLDILSRRRANNPIVVGPPGVGKTAIVEGLAARLVSGGEGVFGLDGRIVVEISAGGLVSGTGVRGALAERLRALRDEVGRSEGRVILFIDEIHAIFTGGESPDDLSHELKALLSRGELPCIGATTESDFRKYFERDPALARRFSAVHVREPSKEDATEIIFGIAPKYEVHHGVAYETEAVRSAVELSVRYIPTRMLPDKAISVLDLAGARVRRRAGEVVGLEAVAQVVSEQARVPVERLLQRDADKMLELESHVAERVVGHSSVMERIADALRKGAAGFHGEHPMGTFLFLGPTGVGKTETAKALSDIFFPGCPMTRFDMSEFSESHTVARLLGAPPGYVGHDEGGQLTEAVRHRPYQLILLDEIEKAHLDVIVALLPLLDEGRLSDGKGRSVDFTNTIVIMTSNLGADITSKASGGKIGFDDGESNQTGDRVLEIARKALPPEVWNRIDEPLYFGRLSRIDVSEIARRMVEELNQKLTQTRELSLVCEESAIEVLLAAGGYDAALGARPMRRTVARLLEAPLASEILAKRFGSGDVIRVLGDTKEKTLTFERDERVVDAAE